MQNHPFAEQWFFLPMAGSPLNNPHFNSATVSWGGCPFCICLMPKKYACHTLWWTCDHLGQQVSNSASTQTPMHTSLCMHWYGLLTTYIWSPSRHMCDDKGVHISHVVVDMWPSVPSEYPFLLAVRLNAYSVMQSLIWFADDIKFQLYLEKQSRCIASNPGKSSTIWKGFRCVRKL
jgi:hypothetical protein